MVSLILSLEEGHVVEVGLVGNEGIVGVLAGLGASRISGEAIVQMPGSGLRMNTDVLRKEIGVNPSIRQMLLRYVQALFRQITQTAACNARHQLPQRLARWLLMANDCTLANEVNLTHEFLSMMLSVRRPGVTDALNELRDAGIIATAHHHPETQALGSYSLRVLPHGEGGIRASPRTRKAVLTGILARITVDFVCLWPKADIPIVATDVRYWG